MLKCIKIQKNKKKIQMKSAIVFENMIKLSNKLYRRRFENDENVLFESVDSSNRGVDDEFDIVVQYPVLLFQKNQKGNLCNTVI